MALVRIWGKIVSVQVDPKNSVVVIAGAYPNLNLNLQPHCDAGSYH